MPAASRLFLVIRPRRSRVEMADDLGDDWWEDRPVGAASSPGTHCARAPAPTPTPPPPPRARPRASAPPPLAVTRSVQLWCAQLWEQASLAEGVVREAS